ncbi:hypothetical protein Hte_001031 [Hypoxylon texense]
MADSIGGDGLYRLDTALEAFITDPQQLDLARDRFNESPSDKSYLSHNSARSQSPEPLNEEQKRREEQRWQLIRENRASLPSNQFADQCHEEEQRILGADGSATLPDETRLASLEIRKLAKETIKNRWVEQGIWSDKWKDADVWRWKHEEPLELEPELENNLGTEDTTHKSSSPRKMRTLYPRQPTTSEKQRATSERRAMLEWEREQSRPYYQFIFQVLKECERIQNGVLLVSDSPDINSRAYENVKNTWVRRGIWNRKWGVLPGMVWKHETEEMEIDSPPPVADTVSF